MLCCCRRNKIAIKSFLHRTQYFYIVDSDKQFNNILHTLHTVTLLVKQWLRERAVVLFSMYIAHLVVSKSYAYIT